ncbi:MAG: toprim domain-containing protein [Candidatus Thorarchaeota archaeon]|nr:hypothetical protein [Thermoplasmatales archaeon]
MYIESKAFIDWIVKELKAKKLPNKDDEYICNCPFCDAKENHWDYTINTKKMIMNCWRGFDPRCESGHTIPTLITLYYDIPFKQAIDFIKKNFRGEDSLQRVKKRLKNIDERRILEITEEKVVWSMPYESESILDAQSKKAQKALRWLLDVRKIPLEVVEALEPRYLGSDTHKKWERYRNRIFFPVSSNGNKAWLAYSTRKKSTKKNPKTMNPPGHILACTFYLYDWYVTSDEPILLHEGLFDAVRFFMFGFNSLAGWGTTVSSEQIELLNALPAKEVVVCYDPDATKLKQDKKGKWTCRAYKVAENLRNYYFGDVSVMKLTRDDPDRTAFKEAKTAYENRMRFGDRFWRLRRLKENLR